MGEIGVALSSSNGVSWSVHSINAQLCVAPKHRVWEWVFVAVGYPGTLFGPNSGDNLLVTAGN